MEGEAAVHDRAGRQSQVGKSTVFTIAVLARELGRRRATLVSAFTVVLAVLAGGVVHRLIPL
jgi:hypothetical protein